MCCFSEKTNVATPIRSPQLKYLIMQPYITFVNFMLMVNCLKN